MISLLSKLSQGQLFVIVIVAMILVAVIACSFAGIFKRESSPPEKGGGAGE